jgi:hypothetical protein
MSDNKDSVTKIFLSSSGILMEGEFPEPPETLLHDTHQKYQHAITKWEAAVEAAKASAVEIEEPGYEFCRRFLTHNGISAGEGSEQEVTQRMGMLRKGELLLIPPGWTVEYHWDKPCIEAKKCLIADSDNKNNCDQIHRRVCQKWKRIARLIPLASGIKYMHDRDCRRYRDESVLCQEHCYFKNSGLKECPSKVSGIAAIGIPEPEYPQNGAGDPYPIFEQFSLLKDQPTTASPHTNSPVIPEGSENRFNYFHNHGDEDGNNSLTIYFGDLGEPLDEPGGHTLITCENTEEDAIEVVKRLNHILFQKSANKQAIDDTLKGDSDEQIAIDMLTMYKHFENEESIEFVKHQFPKQWQSKRLQTCHWCLTIGKELTRKP